MILDQSDPTGLGLFSRCARNQACKTTKTRPQTANSNKSKNSPKIHQNRRQKTINQDMFAKQQSRDQRQRKYQRQNTPAVGQYNNIILKQKPKLVWDVIKLYHKKTKHVKQLQQLKDKIHHNHKRSDRNYKSLDFEGSETYGEGHNNNQSGTIGFNDTHNINQLHQLQNTHQFHSNNVTTIITQPPMRKNSKNLLTQSFNNVKQLHSSITDKNNQHSPLKQQQNKQTHNQWLSTGLKKKSIVTSKICMVDMSRTTGRQEVNSKNNDRQEYSSTVDNDQSASNFNTKTIRNQLNQTQSQDIIELIKSVQKIKPRTKPNYYFKKMLGRKDQHNKLAAGNVYDCNIDVIKPKRSALLNFGIVKGRDDQSLKKQYQRGGHSYTHYDFNQYVWKSTSAVFPNTKKNLIPFDKQR